MNNPDSHKLETAVHAVLRKLPDRKAPAGLESRVRAELLRRASLPWWKKSFAHWPAAVRAAFYITSALTAALVAWVMVGVGGTPGALHLAGDVSSSLAWVSLARDLVASAGSHVRMLVDAVPPLWLYSGIAAIAGSYAVLAALGATAYRAFFQVRPAS